MATLMHGIEGSVFVITGAAGAIGSAMALVLAQHGGRVVITDLASSNGEEVAANLSRKADPEAGTRNVQFMAMDVTDPRDVETVASRVETEVGPVYGFVANAGIAPAAPSLELADETWRKTMAINLDGVFYCARSFGRAMVSRGDGAMVLVSSIAGVKVVRPEVHLAYDASKAAVAQMAATLGVEWAKLGVRVNAIGPGYTDTPILSKMKEDDPKTLERWMEDTPMGRLMKPEEIANVALFLLSSLSSAITGALIMADGGYSRW